MRFALAVVLVVAASLARAQDVLSLGNGTTEVPVSVTRTSADAVNGLAFKVLFDGDAIGSMAFSRTGAFASASPLYERSQQGSGWFSYVVLFGASTNLAGQIGLLTVNAQPGAAPGSIIALRLHPPSATLSNQSASATKTVANGLLALSNGSVTIEGTIAAPSGVVATASGTSLVNVTWNAVAEAAYYEVWRSVDGSAFSSLASPTAPPYADSEVVAGKAYLYRIRAVDSSGAPSPLSSPDVATTLAFSDDPAVAAATTIRLVHVTQLRQAVNAFRASASLASLPADPTISAGAVVRASHVSALRTGLNEARTAVGMPALTYASPLTLVRASHVNELRNGVK